jgi:5-methylcytosine-specific restriction endonuclease McrA
MKIYKCKLCGKKISYKSAHYGLGMCRSCCRIGKKHSQATRDKMSKSHKGKPSNKLGKYHTEATKQKQRESALKRWQDPKEREKVSGKNHHNYIHGLSKSSYSADFTPTLKKSIKKRDNYKCQLCGMTQEEHFKKYNSDIEIHHIDYNTFNCDKSNLITLCKKCNITANFDRDYWYSYYIYIMENNYEKIR